MCLTTNDLTIPAYAHSFLFKSLAPSAIVGLLRVQMVVSMTVKFTHFDGINIASKKRVV